MKKKLKYFFVYNYTSPTSFHVDIFESPTGAFQTLEEVKEALIYHNLSLADVRIHFWESNKYENPPRR
jgi:hypothetical protein